ncbi:hypothetical protein HOH87_05890 [bacterium]|jgi:hypothetical protein|nr:hypothetical protein [bacterium]
MEFLNQVAVSGYKEIVLRRDAVAGAGSSLTTQSIPPSTVSRRVADMVVRSKNEGSGHYTADISSVGRYSKGTYKQAEKPGDNEHKVLDKPLSESADVVLGEFSSLDGAVEVDEEAGIAETLSPRQGAYLDSEESGVAQVDTSGAKATDQRASKQTIISVKPIESEISLKGNVTNQDEMDKVVELRSSNSVSASSSKDTSIGRVMVAFYEGVHDLFFESNHDRTLRMKMEAIVKYMGVDEAPNKHLLSQLMEGLSSEQASSALFKGVSSQKGARFLVKLDTVLAGLGDLAPMEVVKRAVLDVLISRLIKVRYDTFDVTDNRLQDLKKSDMDSLKVIVGRLSQKDRDLVRGSYLEGRHNREVKICGERPFVPTKQTPLRDVLFGSIPEIDRYYKVLKTHSMPSDQVVMKVLNRVI